MTRGLVYHQGGLGDFVLSIPAILRAAAARPLDRWHLWGPSDRLALLPGFARAPVELFRSGHTLWGEAPDPEALRLLDGYDAVVAFGGRTAPSWPNRISHALALSGFPREKTGWVPHHQSRQLDALRVPRPLGPLLRPWRLSVLPNHTPREVVLHPGSGDARKNLPPESWRRILSELTDRLNAPARIVLGPVEAERGDGAAWRAGASCAVSVCQTLGALISVLSGAAVFLGNDSGATHVAGILGVPTVALFGPSDPNRWRPLGPAARWVRTAAPCAPCTDGGVFDCREPGCLGAVPPSAVLEAALEITG